MAKLTKPQLFDIVVRSVAESGWNILYLSTPSEHPFKMQIYRGDESIKIRIYIGNQEIAIAFKPSFFVEYVKDLELLHSFGESKGDLEILESVAEEPQAINNSTIEQTSAERKTTVISVREYSFG